MKILKALVLATFALSAAANADGIANLQPLQAHTVSMPTQTAVIYYTVLPNGDFEVVSTIAPNSPNTGVASQQRTHLSQGQQFKLYFDTGSDLNDAQVFEITAQPESLHLASK